MALEKTFRELTAHLQKTHEAFKEVRLTVVEDRPPKQDVVIVDRVEYAIEDILGWLEGALNHAADAQRAAALPDMERVARSLGQCQELFHKARELYVADLISYVPLDELMGFGRQRRGGWQAWVESAKNGLEQCRHPMEEAAMQLTRCWQELTERLGSTHVSVHAINIGQQIAPKTRNADKTDKERTS